MLKKALFLILINLTSIQLFGQSSLVLENLPASVKWYHINTPHFKIIYPQGFYTQGLRMANTMEHIHKPVAASLGRAPVKQLPLILQNNSSVSNGFVTLGPRRSEFFTMSPQRASLIGNNDWLDMLALHEYRHVVQYDRSRTGFTGFMSTIFGEYTQAAVASAVVPSWFWEGDAVGVETAFSQSGRGRIPQFTANFRANLLEKGSFNYNKAYLKSFKDFMPNHYVLGYYFSTYLKKEYGLETLENMVDRTWSQPYIPFSFSFSQKKYAGEKMPEMYQSMMADLEEKLLRQQQELSPSKFLMINKKPKKVYTDYNYPQLLDNGNLVAVKTGLGDYPQFVEIDVNTGEESKIFTPGVVNNSGMLSAQDGILVWNEFEFDPRWRQRSYSVIKVYNMALNEVRKLTSQTRYTSAAISPDRSKIATIEQDVDYMEKLVILDTYSGAIITTIPAPPGSSLSIPVWTDNQKVVVAEVYYRKKKILEIDIETRAIEVLLEPSYEQISYAQRKGDYLYYVSGVTGIDNIYAKQLKNGQDYQVTVSKFGATNFTFSKDGSILYYNELNSQGNDIAAIELIPSQWSEVVEQHDEIAYYKEMVAMEDNTYVLDSVPNVQYEEERYRKKIGKLHSWGPYLANSTSELEAGLYSRNLLSTTDMFAGFRVDLDNNFIWLARMSFQSWYPIIDVEADYSKRNAAISYYDTASATSQKDRLKWDETGVKAGIRLPWLLTNGKFYTNFELRNYIGLTAVQNFESDVFGSDRYFLNWGYLADGNLLSNEFRLLFSTLHARSRRDIASKWGAIVILESNSTPYGGDYDGGLFAAKGQLYVPGLFKHHSLNFFGGYQHIKYTLDNNNYLFSNRMPYPRGVQGSSFQDFYTLRVNYDLPLLYPDLSIGPWLYIQRIKSKFFYDYGYGQTDVKNPSIGQLKYSYEYFSTGVELTFDFNFMRALPLLELGVRFSYLPDQATSSFEFLVGSFGF